MKKDKQNIINAILFLIVLISFASCHNSTEFKGIKIKQKYQDAKSELTQKFKYKEIEGDCYPDSAFLTEFMGDNVYFDVIEDNEFNVKYLYVAEWHDNAESVSPIVDKWVNEYQKKYGEPAIVANTYRNIFTEEGIQDTKRLYKFETHDAEILIYEAKENNEFDGKPWRFCFKPIIFYIPKYEKKNVQDEI